MAKTIHKWMIPLKWLSPTSGTLKSQGELQLSSFNYNFNYNLMIDFSYFSIYLILPSFFR